MIQGSVLDDAYCPWLLIGREGGWEVILAGVCAVPGATPGDGVITDGDGEMIRQQFDSRPVQPRQGWQAYLACMYCCNDDAPKAVLLYKTRRGIQDLAMQCPVPALRTHPIIGLLAVVYLPWPMARTQS